MANTIQIKRGLEADRSSVTPAAGELLYTTDTKQVFVGDGSTAGGNALRYLTLGANQTATFEAAVIEKYAALSGTTPTIDTTDGNFYAITTSGNTTFTFGSVAASGYSVGFALKVTQGGAYTLTWPASVDWAGGAAPAAPASGATDVYVFITHDGGATWYGFLGGAAMA